VIYISVENYGGMILTGEKLKNSEKIVPKPLYPSEIPDGQTQV
jgi:hypothetical protein